MKSAVFKLASTVERDVAEASMSGASDATAELRELISVEIAVLSTLFTDWREDTVELRRLDVV